MSQLIYTKANWAMLTYLWPNGSTRGNEYTVWLDVDSVGYESKLELLRKHSPYMACIVHSYSECGVVTFTKGF